MAEKNIQGLGKLAKAYSEKFSTDEKKISVAEATRIVKSVFEVVYDSLNVVGDQVDIADTAHIKVVQKAERNGFNPQTKEPMVIPASVGLKVTVGKALKAKLNS